MDHPLICELLETYTDPNFVYFVNQFYTGGEIHDLMYLGENNTETKDPKPLTEKTLKPLVYQILRALNYMKQRNILHRDLKPENIMIESYIEPSKGQICS